MVRAGPATFARLAATAGATEDVNAKDMTCTTMDVSGVTSNCGSGRARLKRGTDVGIARRQDICTPGFFHVMCGAGRLTGARSLPTA